jgi:hypothetical protein
VTAAGERAATLSPGRAVEIQNRRGAMRRWIAAAVSIGFLAGGAAFAQDKMMDKEKMDKAGQKMMDNAGEMKTRGKMMDKPGDKTMDKAGDKMMEQGKTMDKAADKMMEKK